MKTKPIIYCSLLALLLLVTDIQIFAQKPPIKFGKVTKEEMEMSIYPPDTSAAAVILCDYGYFTTVSFEFTRILRIKILKKEGTSWGDKVFPSSKTTVVRGISFNLEGGEIVETKLKSESVFSEKVSDDIYRTRIAMPNVRVGTVIDIKFVRPWLPREWRFQETIPVVWSELIIEESPYVNFRRNYSGLIPLSINSTNRWVAQNVPAFKEEPYISNPENYLSKFTIELLSINIPPRANYRGYHEEFSTSWPAITDFLLRSHYFGEQLTGCAFLNDKVKEIEENSISAIDKLEAAFAYVKQNVKWNKSEALFISGENLLSVFKDQFGNSADINLILIQMLKKLDFKVYPLVLSTRSNGFLSPVFPSLDQLNYVVAYVMVDDKYYFLDATEEYLPVGMLPVRCINLQGRIIDPVMLDWVDLIPAIKYKSLIQAELTLEPNLFFSGKVNSQRSDYAGLNFRNDFSTFNATDDYLKGEENKYPGLTISEYSLTGLDSIDKPLTESYEVKIKNRVTQAGNQLYFYPLLFEQITENPFKSEDRQYPIDFIYPIESTCVFSFTIPEEYKIIDLPKPMVLRLPDNSFNIQYQVSSMGNKVYLTYKFSTSRSHYAIDEYPALREFYSELINKHSEPVILEKL